MNEENENKRRKNSTFQIVGAILVGILIVAIIVQIGIIISLKNKIDKLNEENSKLPEISDEKMPEFWQEKYLKNILKLN